MKHILIALLTSMVLLSSCDQSDDLNEIFLGTTWKLTNIFWNDSSNRPCTDYWTGENAEKNRDESYKLLGDDNKFILRFDGLETEDDITGAFTVQATGGAIEGKWNANGKSRAFNVYELESEEDKDPLGTAFIYGLKNAYKYSGDKGSGLQIFFKDGNGRKRYLLLRVE